MLHAHYLQWPTWRQFDVVYFMISRAVHLQVSTNGRCSSLHAVFTAPLQTLFFYLISVDFVTMMSAFKRAEYFYTNKQTKKKHVSSLKISTGSTLAGLIMGATRTTAASPEAGYCYKSSPQSTMDSFDGRFRWLITLTHWIIMLVMNRKYAGTCTFSAAR